MWEIIGAIAGVLALTPVYMIYIHPKIKGKIEEYKNMRETIKRLESEISEINLKIEWLDLFRQLQEYEVKGKDWETKNLIKTEVDKLKKDLKQLK